MDIVDATIAYEAWLASRMPLLKPDLQAKHDSMAAGAFPHLRATFYRWADVWPEACVSLASAPDVHAVGDLHVENFGTWRDTEGRLVWGVNDFDEACVMPYASDLVRLATSALLAIREDVLSSEPDEACDAILQGYADGMKEGGRAFVLAEDHDWLRALAQSELREPGRFWKKLTALSRVRGGSVPADVRRALLAGLPGDVTDERLVHRQAGIGSLGRRRFALVCKWGESWIAREAKELTTSAWLRRGAGADAGPIGYVEIARSAVRVEDPFVRMSGSWVVRRLSPDCSRIELKDLPGEKDELRLLEAMGLETANVHLRTPDAKSRVGKDLRRRPDGWLRVACETMAEITVRDWKKWRAS